MTTIDKEYVQQWLWKYGHFRNPSFPDCMNVDESSLAKLNPTDKVWQDAVRSIQSLDANLDALSERQHGRVAVADGNIGPATVSLMQLPRCGRPDYGGMPGDSEDPERATGSGAWPVPGCDPKAPTNIHSVRVRMDTSKAPSKIKSYLKEVTENVERMSAEIGISCRHIMDDPSADAEHDVKWEFIRGGVIGYAYFPTPGTCRQTVVARLDTDYQPDVQMFSLLATHEYQGHSLRLEHTRGGVMNPSIMRVPLTWKGDPSFRTLQRYYGGEPIDRPDSDPPTDPDEPSSPVAIRGVSSVEVDGKVVGEFIFVPKPEI